MHLALTDLRLFLAVVEAGSITAGAAQSGLALAAASTRIRRMEEQAGLLLLERGRRGVVPTAAGTALSHHARAVLRQIDQMRSDIGAFAEGLKGRVRLVANTAAMAHHLPEALAGFLVANPAIDLDLAEASSIAVVRAIALATADLGIAADHADMTGLEYHPFRRDRLMLAMPEGHALSGKGPVAFAEALAFDFIGLDDDSALQRHVADHAARTGRRMRVRAKARSLDLVCRMVGAGAGLAVVPQAASRRGAAGPGLVLVPLTESWAERRLMLVVRRRDQLPPYAGRLLGYLLASAPPEASAAEARVRPGRSPSGSAAARSPRSTTP